MRRSPIFGTILLIITCFLPASYADNIGLTNPGFDTGDFSGWNIWNTSYGVDGKADIDIGTTHLSPPYSAKAWSNNDSLFAATSGAWQSFNAAYSPHTTFFASAYMKSPQDKALRDGAEAWFSLKWYDIGDIQIDGTESSAHLTSATGGWQLFQLSGVAVPEDAVTGRIELRLSDPGMLGDKRVVFFDDVRVWSGTATGPEPVSTILFLAGGAALASRRFFRK